MTSNFESSNVEYSVVIPVYNSNSTLSELHSRLESALEGLAGSFEIIFVNDGSSDGSWGTLERLHSKDKNVRILKLPRNLGQHKALFHGLKHARGACVITLDDDLQNPPEEIPKLVEKLSEGYDVVYGTWQDQGHVIHRRILSKMRRSLVNRSLGLNLQAFTSFRALKRGLVDKIIADNPRVVHLGTLISRHTTKIGFVPVVHSQRNGGKSSYSPAKLAKFGFDMLVSVAGARLRMSGRRRGSE